MKKIACVTFWLFIPILVSSCFPVLKAQNDVRGPRYEAKAWLESNSNPYAFAGNRFASTQEALSFVELLYEHGAVEVLVTGIYDEDWRIESEGGPYADTLIIRLPSDPRIRDGLFELANEEMSQEGFDPENDDGQEELWLWWD
jgi:hypothetical protein